MSQAQTRQQFSRIKDQVSQVLVTRQDGREPDVAAEPSQPVTNVQTTPAQAPPGSAEWQNYV